MQVQVPEAFAPPSNIFRLAEIDFGRVIKARVSERLASFGIKAKDIGYELRCTDPIPFDMEYTRDLGYYAAKFLPDGGSGAMVTVQQGKFKPIRFADMLDPGTGRTRVRMVDVNTEFYKVARRYMLRLRKDEFADPAEVQIARAGGYTALMAAAARVVVVGVTFDVQRYLP